MHTEQLSPEERRALNAALAELNEKAWGLGVGLMSGLGLFIATNLLLLKGGEHVGSHLQLLRVYFPGYSVSFVGSAIGFVYAFVCGYIFGRSVVALYYRLAHWIG